MVSKYLNQGGLSRLWIGMVHPGWKTSYFSQLVEKTSHATIIVFIEYFQNFSCSVHCTTKMLFCDPPVRPHLVAIPFLWPSIINNCSSRHNFLLLQQKPTQQVHWCKCTSTISNALCANHKMMQIRDVVSAMCPLFVCMCSGLSSTNLKQGKILFGWCFMRR